MNKGPVLLVLIAGTLFGLCVPFSKVLIGDIEPIMMAGLLYAGAAVGTGTWFLLRKAAGSAPERISMERSDLLYLMGSTIFGAIAAPILLMVGLKWTAGSDASLLLNLEGVMTAIIAVAFFHDKGGYRLWLALAAMTVASTILSYAPGGGFGGNGALLIVLSMLCWGIDNNLMQRISHLDPIKLSTIRSGIAATFSLTLALILYGGQDLAMALLYAMIIGTISYGLSNVLFFVGLRHLGSSRTGTLFSVGPYAAAMAAIPLLGESVTVQLVVAGLLMAAGTILLIRERRTEK
ncbi:MAG TPA: DMT family transporter [Methanomassiliicoccales archaeon]|nr:DMT family transporter [Methanomassiliicoccales archaeon]HQQ25159.1 DMT family transporter [Methanomassiliicoccales archaeon]